MVEGTYEKDNWKQNDNEWVLKVQQIILLSSALEYITKKLTIFINLNNLTPEYIKNLDQACRQYKGQLLPKFVVVDPIQDIKLDFLGIKKKLSVTNELLNEFENIGIRYRLN